MAELADALDSGSSALTGVEVQVLFPALSDASAGLPAGVFLRPLSPSPGRLEPPTFGVHLWVADPDRPPLPPDDRLEVLSAAEQERFTRMGHRPAADRFARSRGRLRHLLACYRGENPAAVSLTVSPDGKPEVAGGPHFNLSHTAGRLLIAVAASPVGVDVEPVRPVPAADDLVRRWFHADEVGQYFALPADRRPAAFRRGWTCKEALLKGVGCGARELAGCVVELDPDRPPAVRLSPDGRAWHLAAWEADGFAAAVAVRAG